MEPIHQLTTPHLVLRKARKGDLESIWKNVWSDQELSKTMLWPPCPSMEEAQIRLESILPYHAQNDAFFVCLRETDEAIGFAGIQETAPGKFEETGLCIARRFQGMGYGREMLQALIHLAFEVRGGKCFFYACFHENAASAALCQGCGFAYSHSERGIRSHDGYAYLCDYYRLNREKEG